MPKLTSPCATCGCPFDFHRHFHRKTYCGTCGPEQCRAFRKESVRSWVSAWWTTWRVWRSLDAEGRRILTSPIDPNDLVEAPRPG